MTSLLWLKHSKNIGQLFSRETSSWSLLWLSFSLFIHALFDTYWDWNSNERTSTNAYVGFFGCNPIWKISKKQRSLARSWTEVEYRVAASKAYKLIWIDSLLKELGVSLCQQKNIYCDNVTTMFSVQILFSNLAVAWSIFQYTAKLILIKSIIDSSEFSCLVLWSTSYLPQKITSRGGMIKIYKLIKMYN